MPGTNLATAQEIYSMRFIKALTRALAAMKVFSTSFSDEAKEVGEVVKCPLVTPDAVAAWDPENNNFVRSTADLHEIKVDLATRIIAGFGITTDQMLNFRPNWWEGKADLNVQIVADTILTAVCNLVTAENYGDEPLDKMPVALGNFNRKTVGAIRAAAIERKMRPNRSALCLNPSYYSALLGDLDALVYGGPEAIRSGLIPNLLGFAAIVEVPQYAGAGFVCHPDAIAVATRRIPLPDPVVYKLVSDLTEPDTGLTMTQVIYVHGPDGSMNNSINASFGCAVGNSNALMRLESSK